MMGIPEHGGPLDSQVYLALRVNVGPRATQDAMDFLDRRASLAHLDFLVKMGFQVLWDLLD